MAKKKKKTANKGRKAEGQTRRAILDRLKHDGPLDAAALGKDLGVTTMAVRQHLYALREEKVVESEEERRPIGRPATLWRLTEAADEFFPSGHADLTVSLIQNVKKAFGAEGLEQLLAVRLKEQVRDYRKRMPKTGTLKKRLDALCKIRTEEGFMAEAQKQDDGTWLLIERHCPICTAATVCIGLCETELDLFRAILGKKVDVQPCETVVTGARRCAFCVREERKS